MDLRSRDYYKFTVRPTVVITTVSKRDIPNAAPFSFNSPISFDPPLFGFASNPTHDTWRNIKENGEFVVNLVGESFGPLMHILEQDWPYEVSEIEKAGLSSEKAHNVRPPRIKEAYAWLECKMETHIELGDHIWIVGRVLEAEVKDESHQKVLDVEKIKPLNHIWGKYFVNEMRITEYKRALKINSQ